LRPQKESFRKRKTKESPTTHEKLPRSNTAQGKVLPNGGGTEKKTHNLKRTPKKRRKAPKKRKNLEMACVVFTEVTGIGPTWWNEEK